MSKKLLLVERSLAIQKLVELALSKEAIEVVTVTNGLSALDILSKVPPDLLMVDSQLEGMNMKAGIKVNQPPVLLLTQPEDLVEPEALRASGVWGCIEKPLEAALLRSRVVDILQSVPSTSPIGDPEETMVAPFSNDPPHFPTSASQGEDEMMKIEDLLGWSSDEKSPFSELEEEKSSDDLSFPLEDVKGESAEKGGGVVLDEEVDVSPPTDLYSEKQDVPPPVSEIESEILSQELPSPEPEQTVVEGHHVEPDPSVFPEGSSVSKPILTEGVSPSVSSPGSAGIPELSQEQIEAMVSKISREIIEKVVWEVVPSLAEIAIQKEIERLKAEDPS
jgi:CheY-like chemotaxis protein